MPVASPERHNGRAAAAGGCMVAQGYVPKELAGDTSAGAFEIEIIGENRKATIITEPLFDPEGKRMRDSQTMSSPCASRERTFSKTPGLRR